MNTTVKWTFRIVSLACLFAMTLAAWVLYETNAPGSFVFLAMLFVARTAVTVGELWYDTRDSNWRPPQ